MSLVLVLMCVLAASFPPLGRGAPRGLANAQRDSVACAVHETGRYRLTVDGGELYVEPRAFVASADNLLLAGWPTYRFALNADGTRRQVTGDDHLFGAIIREDGSTTLVSTPIEARRIGVIRAIPDGRGRWEVLFSELTDFPQGTYDRPDSVVQVWYGILGASGRWSQLDVVPMPADLPIPTTVGSSRLLRMRDTLFWASVFTVDGWRHDVAVFRRVGSRWHHERIVTRRAGYLDLAHDDSLGLILAVVRPDTTLDQDVSSLFLYSRFGGWHQAERLSLGRDDGANHYPRFSESHHGTHLSWYSDTETGREVRAVAMNGLSHESPVVVDSDYAVLFPPQTVRLKTGETLWATTHRGSEETFRIRFARWGRSGVLPISERASPYIGSLWAGVRSNGELVTVGGLWDPRADVIASLVIRNRVTYCPLD